jgi:hyperosmotically inducible periplasmic protein
MKRWLLLMLCCPLLIILSDCETLAYKVFSVEQWFVRVYNIAKERRSVAGMMRDEKIVDAILAKFLADDSVNILDISVYCYNGNVYLVGEYEAQQQKTRPVEIAKKVEGVKSVSSYLIPKVTEACGMHDNLRITAEITTTLVKDKEVASTNVQLKAVQCNVVLLGVVGSREEVQKAIGHATSVKGVRSVKSFLTVAN